MIVGTTRIQKIARIFQIRGGIFRSEAGIVEIGSGETEREGTGNGESCTSDFVHSHFRLLMKMPERPSRSGISCSFLPDYCTVTFRPVLLLSPALSVTVTVMAVVKLTSTFPDEEVDVA